MKIKADSIKTLREISKTALLKSHRKTGSWHKTFLHFEIRDIIGYDIAHKHGIDTAIKVKPKLKPKSPVSIKKPLTKLAKRVWKAVTARRKRKITRISWFVTQRPTKKGWWLTYRIQVGLGSPPYEKGEYLWKQRSHFIHSNPKRPRLDIEIARARDRGNPDIKKGWFKLVWCGQKCADKNQEI